MKRGFLAYCIAAILIAVSSILDIGLLGVELKTEPGEKLIDLEKVIDGIGKTGNPNIQTGEGEEEDTEKTEEEEEEIDPLDAVAVKVDFTDIYLDNSLCVTTEVLKSRLSAYSDLKKAVLMDDYAEAHVLKGVWKTLEEAGMEVKYELVD